MSKKTKKPNKIAYKGPTLLDKLPNNRGEWLELCIRLTERTVFDSKSILANQLERFERELEQWKVN